MYSMPWGEMTPPKGWAGPEHAHLFGCRVKKVGRRADGPVDLGDRALLGTAAAMDFRLEFDVLLDCINDLACSRGEKGAGRGRGVGGFFLTLSPKFAALLRPPC